MTRKRKRARSFSSSSSIVLLGTVVLSTSSGCSGDAHHDQRGDAGGDAGQDAGVDPLLQQRVGYGRQVTGGIAATSSTHVTTQADSGPGSLREAVTGDDARWIVFDGDYTIVLMTPLEIGKNKTLDGRQRHVTINAGGGRGTHTKTTGLILSDNVILEDLTLTGFGDQDQTGANNPADAIDIDGVHGVWIDHCDLSGAADKLVSIVQGSTDITISWNHFHDQMQNIQIGSQSSADSGDEMQNVTIHHNFFDDQNFLPTPPTADTCQNSGYRHPALSHGRVHAFNNYIVGWSSYGSRSERSGRLFLENNVYEAAVGGNLQATKYYPQGVPDGGPPPTVDCTAGQACVAPYKNVCGCNDNCSHCDPSPGFILARENVLKNNAVLSVNEPERVEAELVNAADFYPYSADPADDQLVSNLKMKAGWALSP
jgi:pectate lyase